MRLYLDYVNYRNSLHPAATALSVAEFYKNNEERYGS